MTFEVTIPVLNEESTLETQVEILFNFLKRHFPEREQWSIMIADNGSTDETFAIGTGLSKKHPQIKILSTAKRGVGLALKTSWTQSTADIVGYMDLDLATDLNHFPKGIKKLEKGFDLFYGTRLHAESKVIGRTLKREITSRAFNLILQTYLGTQFSDGMCGFKFLKRKHLPLLMEKGAVSDGWFFSTELLAVAEWHDLKIYELPVTWTDDAGSSKVKIFSLAKEYLSAMNVLKKRHLIV